MMKRANRRKKIKSYIEREKNLFESISNDYNDYDNEDNDQLGNNANYQLKRKELSLTEKEQEEELELNSAIDQMNSETKEDMYHHDSSEDDDSDTVDEIYLANEDCIKISLRHKRRESLTDSYYSKDSLSTFTNTILPDDQEKRECFISQNIITYNDILKLIIIGKNDSGKSLFIKKLSNDKQTHTSPTISLEMHKTTIALNNSKVKLELWDTCASVINCDLIKTFYKIAHGFICIANVNSQGYVDLSFIEREIERIISVSSNNPQLFLILNHKDDYQYDHKEKSLNNRKLAELISKYSIQVRYCNINQVNFAIDKEMLTYFSYISNSKKLSNCKLKKNEFYSSDCASHIQEVLYKDNNKYSNTTREKNNSSVIIEKDKDCSPFQNIC